MSTLEAEAYTPSQVAAVTGLPLPSVHKAIERRLIRPKRVRRGGTIERRLSKTQAIYLRLEAQGLNALPLWYRRRAAIEIERDPGIDLLTMTEGGAVVLHCKQARRDVESGLRRLSKAAAMVHSDPDIQSGAPVFKGTRIPVQVVSDMLSAGATVEEILEGYPSLTRERVALAPLYIKAFPRRGRPANRPWAGRAPSRVSRRQLAG